jgi:ABC-type sugar transport system permease subunit
MALIRVTGSFGLAAAFANRGRSPYPGWFFLPAAVIYGTFFIVPTFASLYFSLTRWTLFN